MCFVDFGSIQMVGILRSEGQYVTVNHCDFGFPEGSVTDGTQFTINILDAPKKADIRIKVQFELILFGTGVQYPPLGWYDCAIILVNTYKFKNKPLNQNFNRV